MVRPPVLFKVWPEWRRAAKSAAWMTKRTESETAEVRSFGIAVESTAGALIRFPALLARGAILLYRYSLSSLVGRTCRHLPTCSEYTEEAIARHGLWCGGWMGLARLARCHPLGTHGFDPVPGMVPANAVWYAPWRYGRWKAADVAKQVQHDP